MPHCKSTTIAVEYREERQVSKEDAGAFRLQVYAMGGQHE